MDLHGWPHGVDAWNMEGVIKRQEHCRHAAGHVALFPQACALVQAICKLYVPGGKITTTAAWSVLIESNNAKARGRGSRLILAWRILHLYGTV